MNKAVRFRKSIAFIEEHLQDDINLELAAQAGFTSLMQLYRDCYTYTGHSVKEYIRKRRLSSALGLIKCSELPLAEIAYACGYSSQQALCKYVKSATAMTPLEYRKSETCYFFPRFGSEPVRPVTVTAETIPTTLHINFYDPKLCGIEQRALRALHELLPGYTGRIFGRNGQQLDGLSCYELAVEYDPIVLSELKSSVFHGAAVHPEIRQTFAKTGVINDETEIGLAWNYLYMNWLRTSMFTQANESYFEEYIYKGGEVKKLILYLPVKRRTDYNKISREFCAGLMFLISSQSGEQAEEAASAAVMNYLLQVKPEAISTVRGFYVARSGTNCTCGIRLEQALELPPDSGLEILRLAEGSYAVLESSGSSDSGVLEELLDRYISENGWSRDNGTAFTTYETGGRHEPEKIQMKVWIRLKHVKNR